MELEYTTVISDDNIHVTITFISDIDVNNGLITNLGTGANVNYTVLDSTSIIFISELDSEYELSFFSVDEDTYLTSTLFVNVQSILCGNRKNRLDVNNLIKYKKLDNTSKLIDCLNRVAIAYHRLGHYGSSAQVLEVISQNCEGECKC